jgi:predicted ribosomally synthesized peptide with SipW-like signal peptide
MSQNDDRGQFGISRRKLLGSVATLGAAGAIGGAGTMAFFSDEEEFANNQLTAGELDLKVDWEEHYSDWSEDEGVAPDGSELDIQMSDPGSDDYTALPDPQNPLIWVHNDDLGTFMDNTAIEAYPDVVGDDGVQDPFGANGVGDICEDGADTPEALDSDLRTEGARGEPLISLQDVKPGDFGELTFSAHLCDNPGYLWLTGRPIAAAENGNTEPEAKDGDESGPDDESYDVTNGDSVQDILDSEIELLDEIQTTWWYDDGDNVIGTNGGGGQAAPLCVQIVLDASGSMDGAKNQNTIQGAKELADDVLSGNDDNRVGVTFFSASGYDDSAELQVEVDEADSQNLTAVQSAIDNLPANGGSTAVGAGLDLARTNLEDCPPEARQVMVVLSNGGENSEPEANVIDRADDYCDEGVEINTIAVGQNADFQFMQDLACSMDMAYSSPDPANIEAVFEEVSGGIETTEQVFFRGSLRESLTALSNGNGIPLDGDRDTPFDEINEPADAEGRDCFQPSMTNYIGFAWYLPVDHANEIQGDSVSFDLGFYTEQCRHNSGIGNRQANS